MDQQPTRLFTSQFRNKLKNQIKDLNNYHLYKEIFKVIINHNVNLTTNSNGKFFNLNKLPDIAIEEIMELINLYDMDNTVEQKPIQYKTPYYEYNEQYRNLNPDEKRFLKSKGSEFK